MSKFLNKAVPHGGINKFKKTNKDSIIVDVPLKRQTTFNLIKWLCPVDILYQSVADIINLSDMELKTNDINILLRKYLTFIKELYKSEELTEIDQHLLEDILEESDLPVVEDLFDQTTDGLASQDVSPPAITGIKIIKEIYRRFKDDSYRYKVEKSIKQRDPSKLENVRNAGDVWRVFKNIRYEKIEKLKIACFNKKGELETVLKYQNNSANSSQMRASTLKSIYSNWDSFIFVHNHPLGISKPSNADVQFTKNILDLAKQMDVKIIDHVIIGHNNYFSFRNAEKIVSEFKNKKRPTNNKLINNFKKILS